MPAFAGIQEMRRRLDGKRRWYLVVCALFLAAEIILACLGISVRAQNPEQDWEKAAGGKQEFEVASVRENKSGGGSYSNFTLDNGNAYWVMKKGDVVAPTGSLFSAKNQTLMRFIVFAYKLSGTQELALRFDYYAGLGLHVPDWVRNMHYDIEARAPGPATKDQMRLMMQSLLAERFKLAVHWEIREAPVFAMALVKTGVLGPQLRQHPASDDCSVTAFSDDAANFAPGRESLSALPISCGMIAHLPSSSSSAHRFGGRNVPLAMLAESMATQTGLVVVSRPVINGTGLTGRFDFWMEWTPEDTSEVDNHESGGTFREALKRQLGLKLEPEKGPVQVLVIDHVEQASQN
jgi:uncharacterized protein (TIGR03435 family)